jgi:glycosyltransferase involved in cell wall biosynthesis
MKILFVIDCLGSGGAQRQLVELALGLCERGHAASFLTYRNRPFYQAALDEKRISVACVDERNYLRRFWKMRKHIRNGEYDAVIAFLTGAGVACELAGFPWRGWRLVVGERSANPIIRKSLVQRFYRWLHLLADYVVANSHSNMHLIRSVNPFIPESRCKVIYNAIDFDRWKPSPSYRPRANGQLKLVVVASHQYLKNLSGLIEALRLLTPDELSQLQIEWYGDRLEEPYFDGSIAEARRKIDEYGLKNIVKLYPATIDILPRIQDADVIGLFSFYEGCPNVVCEGMACAKPVICSNVSDVPRFLSYDTNLLFNPTSSYSISETLRYVLHLGKDDLSRIGSKNVSIAKETFARNSIVSEYQRLLGKGGS